MTYSEALDWLERVGRGGSRLGLDRVRAYLTRLGAPQDQIPMIHVAGTNGKGSVSACLSAILTQAGGTLDNVVKTTVFLKDMEDFVEMNRVYKTYFPENCPARSAVQVARLPKDVLVEIEAIAVL